MRTSSFLLVAVLALPSLARADGGTGTFVTNDSHQTLTVECTKDRAEVMINGSHNQITLTGTCTSVTLNGSHTTLAVAAAKRVAINGAHNQIAIDAADKILLTGAYNTLAWKKGLTTKAPKVSNLGKDNTISKTP